MSVRQVDETFTRMLRGFTLTSAEILYHLPDHPSLLQTFFWQFEDMSPNYPRLGQFLDHWDREIEADIHSVRIMHCGLVKPREFRSITEIRHLH